MGRNLTRRLIALLAALLLGFGTIAHAGAAASVDARMITVAAAETPASQDCDLCGGSGGMSETDCYGLCNGTVAVLPHLVPAGVIASAQSDDLIESARSSRHIAPDPSPPKSVVFS